jgi:nicotinamide riboside transporter PnuC
MDQMNFHKQKLYALIAGIVGLISCFLPWWSLGFFGSISGMHDLGIIAFFGFAGGVACCFLDDKSKPFAGQFKMIAAACFAAAALFTLIQIVRVSSFLAIGIWLSLLSGVAGAIIVYLLKPEQIGNKNNNVQP